jgi:hypothetical protein
MHQVSLWEMKMQKNQTLWKARTRIDRVRSKILNNFLIIKQFQDGMELTIQNRS